MSDRVDYKAGRLCLSQAGRPMVYVEPASVLQVDECQMADPLYQDDESFHLLRLADHFWLFGPMVDGALGAVDALLKNHPEIVVRRSVVERVPWRMRRRGLLGLRLWPVAGFGRFPCADLQRLKLVALASG